MNSQVTARASVVFVITDGRLNDVQPAVSKVSKSSYYVAAPVSKCKLTDSI